MPLASAQQKMRVVGYNVVGQCRTSLLAYNDSAALDVLNGCQRYDSGVGRGQQYRDASVLVDTAQSLVRWFGIDGIVLAIVCTIIGLPWICDFFSLSRIDESATIANLSHKMLQAVLLLGRVGVAISLATWLQAAFRQPRPCQCSFFPVLYEFDHWQPNATAAFPSFETLSAAAGEGSTVVGGPSAQMAYLGGSVWGMPDALSLVVFVVGLHVAERVNIAGGVLLAGLVSVGSVFAGECSVAQMLASVAIATAYHFIATRTPLWCRLAFDLPINLVGGILTLVLTKLYTPATLDFGGAAMAALSMPLADGQMLEMGSLSGVAVDWSFAAAYFEGVALQLFALLIGCVFFSRHLLMQLLVLNRRTHSYSLQTVDFNIFATHYYVSTPDASDADERQSLNRSPSSAGIAASAADGTSMLLTAVAKRRWTNPILAALLLIALLALRVAARYLNALI